jgi:VIT family
MTNNRDASMNADGAGPQQQHRPSLHVVPRGPRATAQHYIRDLVYGANDGIITTFAVVAGVAGGSLSARAHHRRPPRSGRKVPKD